MNRVEFLLSAARGKTLDVGFNPSDTALHDSLLEKLGQRNVVGFDVEAREFKPNVLRASAEAMPFRNECFDSIVAGELIEHLHHPELFVRECQRVLRENGVLALSTPNRESWLNRLTHSYEAPLHFSLFSIQELSSLLESNSFKVLALKMFPYTLESSEGSHHKWFFPVRRLVHAVMPSGLRENIALIARKR